MKHALSICRAVALAAASSCVLSACERRQTPPPPSIQLSEGPARSTQSSTQPDAPKLPYGASAPMSSGTEDVQPPSQLAFAANVVDAGNAGMASTPLVASAPDTQANVAPTGAGRPAATVPLSATELTFITQAMDAGLFDLRVGQLAVDRANDSMVKSYAALLVTDQVSLNNGLQQLAKQLGLPQLDSLSEPKQRVLDGLARTGELEFDRQFLGAVGVQEHQATIELFERTGRETRNPVVQAFVLATLPTLRAHLTAAQRLPTRG